MKKSLKIAIQNHHAVIVSGYGAFNDRNLFSKGTQND